MKYFLYIVIAIVFLGIGYLIFHNNHTDRETILDSENAALRKEDIKKTDRINLLTEEINNLLILKNQAHEERLQAQAEATAYRLKWLRLRDGAVPHYSDSAWDIRAKEVVRSFKRITPNF